MSITPTDERIRHSRTHEALQRDITADPIFLFQRRRRDYSAAAAAGLQYDSEAEAFLDDDGALLEPHELEERGLAFAYWETESVFLTRADGVEYGNARAYNYPDGWRVFCVMARGDLVHVLADATVGGRYR